MSRIGKKPIEIPSGVEATLKEGTIEVKGSLGSRHFNFSENPLQRIQELEFVEGILLRMIRNLNCFKEFMKGKHFIVYVNLH